MQEPNLLENFLGAPLLSRHLALPTNNRLGCKYLPGTNILAYYRIRKVQTKTVLFLAQVFRTFIGVP
jgi:hypothetical protein